MNAFPLVGFLIVLLGLSGCSGGGQATNDLPVRCLDEPDPGPCRAGVIRYFYDYRYDRCRPFRYGGCRGHVPFETSEACEETCLGGDR
jgi:hypothetical protein